MTDVDEAIAQFITEPGPDTAPESMPVPAPSVPDALPPLPPFPPKDDRKAAAAALIKVSMRAKGSLAGGALDPVELAKFMRATRKAAKLTMKDMAELLGVARHSYQQWDTGWQVITKKHRPRVVAIVNALLDEMEANAGRVDTAELARTRMRALFAQEEFTKTGLAKKIGVSRQTIHAWIEGHVPIPEIRVAEIHTALDEMDFDTKLMEAQAEALAKGHSAAEESCQGERMDERVRMFLDRRRERKLLRSSELQQARAERAKSVDESSGSSPP